MQTNPYVTPPAVNYFTHDPAHASLPAADTRPIPNAFAALCDALDTAEVELARLEDDLNRVLAPNEPVPSMEIGDVPMMSPIAYATGNAAARVVRIVSRVESIRSRLEC